MQYSHLFIFVCKPLKWILTKNYNVTSSLKSNYINLLSWMDKHLIACLYITIDYLQTNVWQNAIIS